MKRVLLVCIFLVLFSGCAAAFAPNRSKPIDISAISVGMPRTQVEEMLGAPTRDIRPNSGFGAARECDYVYMQRDPLQQEQASYFQLVANRMTGFKEVPVRVHYDANGKVVRVFSHQEIDSLKSKRR